MSPGWREAEACVACSRLSAPRRAVSLQRGAAAGGNVRIARARAARRSIVITICQNRWRSAILKSRCTTRPVIARAASVCRSGRPGRPGGILFVGDTLFAGSIGRTDLPGGDYDTLMRSIKSVLFAFGDDAAVYPGHGPATTIGRERRTNPFLRSVKLHPAHFKAVAFASVAELIRLPFTNVPFVLSRSLTWRASFAGGELAMKPRHQRRVEDEFRAGGAADGLHRILSGRRKVARSGADSSASRIHIYLFFSERARASF